IATPVPVRSVPRIDAVNASSGISACTVTIEASAASRSNPTRSGSGWSSGGKAHFGDSSKASRPSFGVGPWYAIPSPARMAQNAPMDRLARRLPAALALAFALALAPGGTAQAQRAPSAQEVAAYTGLFAAAHAGDAAAIARLTAAGAPVDARDGYGRTPLHVA